MNPDRELLRAFMGSGTQSPISITTNPLACALSLTLIEASAQPGRAVLHCDPLPLFVQGAGVLQGGALSAMVDFAMAFAAMSALSDDEAVATTTLQVAFLRPARAGPYEVIGEIVRRGKTIIFACAELRPKGNPELVVTATSTLSIIRSR